MRLSRFLIGALLLVPAVASAEHPMRPLKASGTADMYEFVAGAPTVNDLVFARQVLPPTTTPPTTNDPSSQLALSRIVYLNKNGVTLTPGTNDARTNRSTIAGQQTTIPAWNVSATTWTATVNCMKEIFAPFDIQIVEADPGNVPHIEAVFGGSPQQLGMGANVAGVSPFTTDCSIIENSIVFTFTNVIPQDARLACEIQAQEVAHSYGLDHELLASDPMTYLDYNGNRSFQNQLVDCGEDTVRPCGINGSVCRSKQNSVQLLTERLGAKAAPGDTIAPTVGITSPQSGAKVPPGFKVSFSANDNVGITMASIYIDGEPSGSVMAEREFTTPADLAEGQHTIRVDVTDGANTESSEITVTIQKGATPPVPPDGDGTPGGGASTDIVGGCSVGSSGGGLLIAFGILLVFAIRRMFRRQAMLDSLQIGRQYRYRRSTTVR
jgi:hypothetical protein